MNVAETIEKIKNVDLDIKSIEWAREQINLVPEDVNSKAWDILEKELNRLAKEKELIMEFCVEDNPSKEWRGGDQG